MKLTALVLAVVAALALPCAAEEPKWGDPQKMTRQEIIDKTMTPYAGPPRAAGVDASTMTGKVLCGYQGWFAAEGDACGRGWYHWNGRQGFKPGSCKIDLWPDVTELAPDERYATAFKLADGRAAEVYSAFNSKTVLRHFKWMQDYGLDGVFVQRFAGEVFGDKGLRQFNVVLQNCREGANRYGRTYAVMYDLSGIRSEQIDRLMDDWRLLVDRMQITRDKAYLHHKGKPVICVWGFGFNDGRKYTVADGLKLVKFLKEDPKYGGCTVMLGIPTYWRTLDRDCVPDPVMHDLILAADVVSPWTVGRYGNPEGAANYAKKTVATDIAWCKERSKEYMPVVFPGFSWHNMKADSKLNQ
ncbi:MAG: glycoside hydrolase family 71/99-like protein, partial [Planctomycetota bacterium]|nr:glycoside hydrolase family 71/99-like protein [Planctomycetota bacterium]